MANQLAARPSLWRPSRTWWTSIFLHFLNVSIVNAWYLYRWYTPADWQPLSPQQFRRILTNELMGNYNGRKRKSAPEPKPRSKAVHAAVKLDNGKTSRRLGDCSVCCKRIVNESGVRERSGSRTTWQCCDMWVCAVDENKNCIKTHRELHHKR